MKKTFILILFCVFIAATICFTASYQLQKEEKYPYHSKLFNALVEESFSVTKGGSSKQFYNYLDSEFTKYININKKIISKSLVKTLDEYTDQKAKQYSKQKSSADKTKFEIENAAWIHKFIKKAIPKFDLDRGFEFSSVHLYGQRQCFLQSVIIASLLQRIGMNAGVVMVYKNIKGEASNNGHALVLLKLSNGKDVLVDASDPIPFVTHKGLFAKSSDYLYVEPVYAKKTYFVEKYKKASGKSYIITKNLKTLDYNFLSSQFYYYRGERVPGGVIAIKKTKKGLEGSGRYLKKSILLCKGNPLSVYMLGRVYMNQGDKTKASNQFQRAYKLYSKYGWIPDGLKDVVGK